MRLNVKPRDLKPENILLDSKHELLKITDFGVSDVVRRPNEQEVKLSRGIAGSDPYIAPEMWECDEYDAFKTDAWSCGNETYLTLKESYYMRCILKLFCGRLQSQLMMDIKHIDSERLILVWL